MSQANALLFGGFLTIFSGISWWFGLAVWDVWGFGLALVVSPTWWFGSVVWGFWFLTIFRVLVGGLDWRFGMFGDLDWLL